MNSMNAILNFFLLLLLPLCVVSGDESDTFCSPMNGESLRYTIRSRKNVTNHRIVSVDFRRDSVPNERQNASTDVDMDVDHTYLQCGGKERIMLSAVASTMELKSSASRSSASVGDYELFPGLGYYKLHTKAVVWETARSICVREGGHLLVINSDAEAEVVKTFFSRKPKFEGSSEDIYTFVGVHDYLKEGETLDKTGYARWGSGQPNGGSGENYVVVGKDGLFRDAPNHNTYGFICERQM